MTTAMTVTHVTQRFGEQTVLEDLNFTVQPGEIIGLIGENGAGKTTLINLLLGLLTPSAGTIHLLGTSPQQRLTREQIGVMFQDNLIVDRLHGGELLQLAQSQFHHALTLPELANLSGLTPAQLRQPVTKLSGGQQRRLNFAIALAGDPQILFLDEPTVGMDSNSRHAFWQVVRQLARQGKTMVVTSHYLEEIQDITTRLLFLKNHHVIYDGSFQQLRQQTAAIQATFTSELAKPTVRAEVAPATILAHDGQHYTIVAQNEQELLSALAPLMTQIQDLQLTQSSLDQIFRDMTGGQQHD